MENLKITPRELFSFIVVTLVYALFPLLIVGRWDWWPGWAYAGLMILSTIASRAIAFRKNPGILAERAHSLENKDAKEWDKKLVPFAAMLGPISLLIVSGLDARFTWTPVLANWIPLTALAALILALLFGNWAFLENQFFSGTVRIRPNADIMSSTPALTIMSAIPVTPAPSGLTLPCRFCLARCGD